MNRRLLAIFFMISATLMMRGDEILDNSSVVRMVKAGLAADIILLKIEQSPTRFDVTTDALIALKSENVPDPVIKAMLLKQPAAPPAAVPPMTTNRCITTTFYTLGSMDGVGRPRASASGPARFPSTNRTSKRATSRCRVS